MSVKHVQGRGWMSLSFAPSLTYSKYFMAAIVFSVWGSMSDALNSNKNSVELAWIFRQKETKKNKKVAPLCLLNSMEGEKEKGFQKFGAIWTTN